MFLCTDDQITKMFIQDSLAEDVEFYEFNSDYLDNLESVKSISFIYRKIYIKFNMEYSHRLIESLLKDKEDNMEYIFCAQTFTGLNKYINSNLVNKFKFVVISPRTLKKDLCIKYIDKILKSQFDKEVKDNILEKIYSNLKTKDNPEKLLNSIGLSESNKEIGTILETDSIVNKIGFYIFTNTNMSKTCKFILSEKYHINYIYKILENWSDTYVSLYSVYRDFKFTEEDFINYIKDNITKLGLSKSSNYSLKQYYDLFNVLDFNKIYVFNMQINLNKNKSKYIKQKMIIEGILTKWAM